MKTILRLFILFMFLPCAVLAKEKVNESSLSQVFDKLRHTQGCVCENVKYSGNNWQKHRRCNAFVKCLSPLSLYSM